MALLLVAAAAAAAARGGGGSGGGSSGAAARSSLPHWATAAGHMLPAERERLRLQAKEMFYHGYDSYMKFAFPHDELQPLTLGWADSLEELGDATRDPSSSYSGVALTLIDALDTLGVMGNATEFTRGATFVCQNVSFEQDVRVNVFELNIRVLGGLLSAHYLASDQTLRLWLGQKYDGCLLDAALDVGNRMLPAFRTSTKIPQPWINLATGPIQGDSRTQCTAGCGTLLLEFGLLSRLTGNDTFHTVALDALQALWSRRSSIGLLGNTLDYRTGRWRNENAGVGAGVDSFYEYLLKSYLVFGSSALWEMWEEAYGAARKYLKHGPWYVQSHMQTGRMVHEQFESLQAFWPALQVLAGDVEEAIETHDAFFSLWTQFGFLPESFLLASRTVHPSMKYYPLRPELAESTYALYRATRDPYYLQQGEQILKSLNGAARVPGGFASVKDVKNPRVLEDRMASFFLAETCKYLFLLFDETNFVHADPSRSLIFNTEGHLIPVQQVLRTNDGDNSKSRDAETDRSASLWEKAAQAVAGAADAIKAAVPRPEKRRASSSRDGRPDPRSCPNTGRLQQLAADSFVGDRESWLSPQRQRAKSLPATSPAAAAVCPALEPKHGKKKPQNTNMLQLQGVEVQAGDGFFKVREENGEAMVFRVMPDLGVEMSHSDRVSAHFYLFRHKEGRDSIAVDESSKTPAGPKVSTSTGVAGAAIDMTVTGFFVRLTLTSSGATVTHCFPASNAMFGPRKMSLHGTGSKADAVPLVSASPLDGCSSQTLRVKEESAHSVSDASVTGSVVVVERGTCAFVSKVYAAQQSGASGVIVVNTHGADLFMMGGDGTPRQGKIRIPSVMVSAASGAAIRSILGQSAAKGDRVLVSFGEHQFELTAPDKTQLTSASGSSPAAPAPAAGASGGELCLRAPVAWGSCTDFSFHGMSDWGIHVTRLADGNYQLMLVGQRFDELGAERDSPTPAPQPVPPPPPAPPHKDQRTAGQQKQQTGVDGWPAQDGASPTGKAPCWVPDRWPQTHKCHKDSDCGVDESCSARSCSKYGFCTS